MNDNNFNDINEINNINTINAINNIEPNNNIYINKEFNNRRNNIRQDNQNNFKYYDNNRNILINKNKDLQLYMNSVNFDYQAISRNKTNNMFMNEIHNNNINDNNNNVNNNFYNNFSNINIIDNYHKSEERHYTDLSSDEKNNYIALDRSKSFDKLPEKYYFKMRNKNKDLSLTHHEIKNKEEKKMFETFYNTTYKEFRKNNYSISNIAQIKIKKVNFPEYIGKRNINRTSNSLLADNKGTIYISNDLSSTIPQKSLYFNDNGNSIRKGALNISKIDKKNFKKNKNINLAHSAKTIKRKVENKNPEKLNSLIEIKHKSKNNISNNSVLFKKGKKYNLSFDKEKNSKDEQIQIGFGKTFNLKNKIKELILINSKNFKKNRKIQI